jgi:hypothetical protein
MSRCRYSWTVCWRPETACRSCCNGHQPLSSAGICCSRPGGPGMQAHACDDLGLGLGRHTHARAAWLCQDCGHPGLRGWIMGTASKLAVWRGDLQMAAQLAHRAVEQAVDGNTRARAAALEARAWARTGFPDRATEALRVCQLHGEAPANDDQAQWGGIFTFPGPNRATTRLSASVAERPAERAITLPSRRAVDLYEERPTSRNGPTVIWPARSRTCSPLHLHGGGRSSAAAVVALGPGPTCPPAPHRQRSRFTLRTAQTAVPLTEFRDPALVLRRSTRA